MYICIRIRAPIVKEASFRTSNSSRPMCQIDNFLACFYSFIDSFISVLMLALSFSSTENFRSENFRNLQIISEPLSLSFSIWESIGIPYWNIPDQEKYQCHCVLYTQNLIVYSIFFCILQFLSMKLEAVTSGMIPSINGFHSKEVSFSFDCFLTIIKLSMPD